MENKAIGKLPSIKEYIGDSVYVEIDSGMLKLTTENEVRVSDEIFLELHVYLNLVNYANKWFIRHGESGVSQ